MLLALTTPIGTGQGVHRALSLHPIFSHTHLVDGQIVSHEQEARQLAPDAQSSSHDQAGASIGAAAGASMTSYVAISPVLPFADWRLEPDSSLRRALPEARLPRGRVEAPPDPPPLPAA
jgi:hypothetical protein